MDRRRHRRQPGLPPPPFPAYYPSSSSSSPGSGAATPDKIEPAVFRKPAIEFYSAAESRYGIPRDDDIRRALGIDVPFFLPFFFFFSFSSFLSTHSPAATPGFLSKPFDVNHPISRWRCEFRAGRAFNGVLRVEYERVDKRIITRWTGNWLVGRRESRGMMTRGINTRRDRENAVAAATENVRNVREDRQTRVARLL